MTVRFDGQVALVTGAGAGLGRAHAMLLAERGAKVVVNDPGGTIDGRAGDAAAADKVVEEIRAAGGEAVANYASVADREGATSIVTTAIEAFGGIHIVVNNAGILRDKTFIKMELDDFETVMQVHFNGTVYVTKAAWPHLIEQGYGRVVFTTSGSGLVGSYGQSNYGAAKTAMLGLMNNLKNEKKKADIQINMVSPVAGTRMTQGIIDEKQFALSTPERVAPAVAWLASKECDFSGETIAAGAGYFARIRLMKSRGLTCDPDTMPTIEDLVARKDDIMDLEGATAYTTTLDAETRAKLGLS
ncbi:SDR family NAD(P)-dependent oxidoreductase [Tropicimonas isoalkanivorans]|uniref:NAD(P)-dependent dehydrogenase, short-chain alcohol dehydrogenase family n=1 Tax=Tropicimonas isoalkanivorans TaxID=441112 RepID=A0A1I1HW12_9RHOB|nr:SDR family NAD(P)-dependent oxidoreductase [Tropicimonas isoalkanivorans]SFC28267.1 NAD(P)-dependent dehydrogenase, short-chain alcohol dehydrogenase family [Tropicimonas isoalkanivorans]